MEPQEEVLPVQSIEENQKEPEDLDAKEVIAEELKETHNHQGMLTSH